MLNRIAEFLEQEDGAVTVDWVVLTAAIVGMGGLVALNFAEPVQNLDASVGSALSSAATHTDNQVITVNFSTPES
ncbi:hypothetical protein [Ruegeria atlantica]|uniref:hypothetical protein n=1 Tax=Ruegeria atlantica TaxID=81569 RepID=UPI00147CDADF|nr:hypothetical protein [Ruegeria atlantica]